MEKVFKLYSIMSGAAVKKMNGVRGKMVSQGGHGFMHAYWDSEDRFPDDAKAYRRQTSAFKITLAVEDEGQLVALMEKYRPLCGVSLVEERGTKADGSINEKAQGVTCLGLGPIDADLIGDDLRALKGFL